MVRASFGARASASPPDRTGEDPGAGLWGIQGRGCGGSRGRPVGDPGVGLWGGTRVGLWHNRALPGTVDCWDLDNGYECRTLEPRAEGASGPWKCSPVMQGRVLQGILQGPAPDSGKKKFVPSSFVEFP